MPEISIGTSFSASGNSLPCNVYNTYSAAFQAAELRAISEYMGKRGITGNELPEALKLVPMVFNGITGVLPLFFA